MSGVPDGFDVENEVAFAALGGWEEALRRALQEYCDHCRGLPRRELERRSRVLLDFDVWADPVWAAHGKPLVGAPDVENGARYMAERIKAGRLDPYAILGALARECGR